VNRSPATIQSGFTMLPAKSPPVRNQTVLDAKSQDSPASDSP
jgi:hypothetical protein